MVDAWSHFHFLRPWLLWLGVPFFLGAVASFARARAASPWRPFIRAELLAHLEATRASRFHFAPEALVVALGTVAVFLAAGPSYRAQVQSGDPSQSPLIVVVDLSPSMAERDVSPSRAERARLELLELLRARPASPTALVVVSGSAHVLMPFTDDVHALEPYVEALSPELMPQPGQNFVAAAQLVESLSKESPKPPALLLVSDGLPAPGARALAELARRRGVRWVALAVGGSDAERSELDSLAGEVIQLSYAGRDLGKLLSAIATSRAERARPDDGQFWEDEAPHWAWPLLFGAAFWFRRGFVLRRGPRRSSLGVAAAALLVLSGCSPAIEGIWLTPDQQGRLAFERGDYEEAARRFADPTWKGLAYYAAEQWDAAAAQFATSDDADSSFLLGNAYAEGGKLQSALHAYDIALQKRPTFRKARQNRDRIDRLIHSLQEDIDADDMKKVEVGNDDAATRPDPSSLAKKTYPDGSSPAAVATSQAGEVEQGLWLSRLSTDPAEFLRRKLAMQAARGAEP